MTAHPAGDSAEVETRWTIARIIKPAAFDPTFAARKARAWGSEKDAAEFQRLLATQALDKADAILAALTSGSSAGEVQRLREACDDKPFAYFQWNEGWNLWEQVVEEAKDEPHVIAAYCKLGATERARTALRSVDGEAGR